MKRVKISFITFLFFIVIVENVFFKVTYLFRTGDSSRDHIVGIEEIGNLDMVYVGGSSTFVYWQPPRAWKEYGITSYDYAVNNMQADTVLGCIREIRKSHEPKLFVVDVRPFQLWTDEVSESGIRNVTDAMDYSWNRIRTVYDSLKNKNTDGIDVLSYYFDIAKYHTIFSALGTRANWEEADHDRVAKYNGWEFMISQEELSLPKDFQTEEKAELAEGLLKCLEELLEYGRKEDLQLLFVVCPYAISREDQMQYNALKEIIEAKGYVFFNANEYYADMDMDFANDFYNTNHTNLYGAEKYTRFLAKYIQEEYWLPDRRADAGMEEWEEMYEQFAEEEKTDKTAIDEIKRIREEAYIKGLGLKDISNLYEWWECAWDMNYTILISARNAEWDINPETKWWFEQWSASAEDVEQMICVFGGRNIVYFSECELEENYKSNFAGHSEGLIYYEINSGDQCSILIDGEEYCTDADGVNIVVYDNNYREVLDVVLLQQDDSGKIVLKRVIGGN